MSNRGEQCRVTHAHIQIFVRTASVCRVGLPPTTVQYKFITEHFLISHSSLIVAISLFCDNHVIYVTIYNLY